MITRVKGDKQKSESLKKMAEITLERLDKTDMEKYKQSLKIFLKNSTNIHLNI